MPDNYGESAGNFAFRSERVNSYIFPPNVFYSYPDIWYQDITSSPRFYSLAAVLNKRIIGILVAEVKSISKCNPEVKQQK